MGAPLKLNMNLSADIQKATHIIQHGGVISYPTESVFGLGCDPLCEAAVKRILKLKDRDINKGLIIIAAKLEQLSPYIKLTEQQTKKILAAEQPTTWLVNKSNIVPQWVTGQHKKVAIRISRHPLVTALCATLQQPIISTSANPAGKKPAVTNQQSRQYFSDQIDMYLDEASTLSESPTPIIDIDTHKIIR